MTLKEIRDWFIDLSGRGDLETEGKADAFINAAIQQLDLWLDTDKTVKLHVTSLTALEWILDLPSCVGVERVYVNSESGYKPLGYKTFPAFMEQYPQLADTTASIPRHYTLINRAEDLATFKLAILPAPLVTSTIQVLGYFNTPPLVEEDDENYWSTFFPLTLVHATLYKLEGSYRNIEGMKSWKVQIDEVLSGIDRNTARIEAGPGPLIMGGV